MAKACPVSGHSTRQAAKLGNVSKGRIAQAKDRYGLEPGDSDDGDEELDKLETVAARKPVRRLIRRHRG
jgi:hypothetical protein